MEYFSFLNVILFQFTASVRVPALALPPSAVPAATQSSSASNKPAVAAATSNKPDSTGVAAPSKSTSPKKVFLVFFPL